ncbi:MAG: hypothetical protein KC731_35220 [Myxococcales bacterium]|nr:hypothetical protein [Myxococcales bacterium]
MPTAPESIDEVHRAIGELAAEGAAVPLAAFGRVNARAGSLVGAAATENEGRRANSDAILLRELACGEERGLLLGVMTGNYKDMGTAVASSLAAIALAAAFAEPLLSEADVVPALRRAAIHAHDGIYGLATMPLGDFRFETVMGARDSLRGIGTSLTAVAVLRRRVFGVHCGDGKAFLYRDGKLRKLALEHTLDHAPGFRQWPQRPEVLQPELIVMNVLGMSADPPKVDVFRTDLEDGDRLVVGGMGVFDELVARILASPDAAPAGSYRQRASAPAATTNALVAALEEEHGPWFPISVGVIDVD